MSEIDILSKKDAISIVKNNKTHVDYYIFDEFEVHHCTIPPHSMQEWHMHQIIEEVICVTIGEISVRWKENGIVMSEIIIKDEILRVKKSLHTIENDTDNCAEFMVFRMVPTGDNKREIIKNDKITFS